MTPIKRKPIDQFFGLKEMRHDGGLGKLYITQSGTLIKIYPPKDNEELKKMSGRFSLMGVDEALYDPVRDFSAVPLHLITDPTERYIIGFEMQNFQNYRPIQNLISKPYCVENKITIRRVVQIFLTLHNRLQRIHEAGFLVGDFNDSNILFNITHQQQVCVAFVDVDSWAIRTSDTDLKYSGRTKTFRHPELEDSKAIIQTYHDWYSFALILTRSLIKNDPFNIGETDDLSLSCLNKNVVLDPRDEMYIRRFGNDLTNVLKLRIEDRQRASFPRDVLERFLDNLVRCTKCKLEVHIDHKICTKCGETLPVTNCKKSPLQFRPINRDPNFEKKSGTPGTANWMFSY